MANKRYDQFTAATPTGSNITLFADPSTGALNKTSLDTLLGINANTGTLLATMQTLGSSIKSFNCNVQRMGAYQRQLLFQNAGYFYLNYLPDCTVTGAWFGFDTANNITATGFNGFALYSQSAGTLTRIAKTANDPTIFTGALNVMHKVPFASPVTVSAGVYYLAMLSCSSAQVSRCMIYANDWYNNTFLKSFDLPNANTTQGTIASLTDLNSTVSTSSITGNDPVLALMGLY